jgi:carotenoid 1,2-hydratase
MDFEIPQQPGSYRWYYFDFQAGPVTAVAIFMLGSLFSPRYSRRQKFGARPFEHSAVNFALYKNGRCTQWILSEYATAKLEQGGSRLCIGNSSLTRTPKGVFEIQVAEQTPWRKRPVRIQMTVSPQTVPTEPIRLVTTMSHYWHPFSPFAEGELMMDQNRSLGRAYHDRNFGDVPLGTDLKYWSWSRTHEPQRTVVRYEAEGTSVIELKANAEGQSMERFEQARTPTVTTPWALSIPARVLGHVPTRLESSPFYARLEAQQEGRHQMVEVADFKRFRAPWIRWMADLRTRYEDSAR